MRHTMAVSEIPFVDAPIGLIRLDIPVARPSAWLRRNPGNFDEADETPGRVARVRHSSTRDMSVMSAMQGAAKL